MSTLFSLPFELYLFAATLLGVAVFHRFTFTVSLIGLAVIIAAKLAFSGFKTGNGLEGLAAHMGHECVLLLNLFLLLTGFAVLARHFEESKIPAVMPDILPDDWTGGIVLLAMVFVISSFLDNIAAAIVGGTVARIVFNGRVHVGYLAAIVAASNAGGSGSVVGDTTTTMLWIAGVSPLAVVEAYIAALTAFVIVAVPAARMQHRFQPILKDAVPGARVVAGRIAVVVLILASAIAANVVANLRMPEIPETFPVVGLAVWAAILVAAPVYGPDWSILPETVKGTIFLLALVTAASMMPIEALPEASATTTLMLGLVSAVFDNIPLTALALKQGGYDWGHLAFAVGFGGSMMWFGSSAGVALSNLFPEAKSVTAWLASGWTIAVGYLAGFFVMLAVVGWHP
jgi:Na+/H+ antiporter NhaD/arsenite permease-like protein